MKKTQSNNRGGAGGHGNRSIKAIEDMPFFGLPMGQNKPDVNCVVGAVTYNDGFKPARKTFKPTPQGASLFDYMKIEDKNQFGTLSGDREGAGPVRVAQARSQAARSQAATSIAPSQWGPISSTHTTKTLSVNEMTMKIETSMKELAMKEK